MDCCCAFRECPHHFLLLRGRLDHDCFILHIGRREMKLIRRLDVCDLTEYVHQLRQIEELCKARPRPIARSLRSQLNRCRGFPEGGSPRIKMRHAFLLQCAVLQIALHSVQLRHTVADGRTRCKHNALTAGDFVHISAFQEHIR